ncbi:MAG: hypothetical protein JWP52_954 [Rhizobacter sp.]|nr:hypothetical protein [Rhizobacter sp.]
MGLPTSSSLAAVFGGALWLDVVRRSDALPKLDRRVLLHAGPPFASLGAMPAAVRQAAVQAILFEGLARSLDTAQALLANGGVQLMPAQNHGVATPLAQVVSASMPLAAVGDGSHTAWAPLIEGAPPALRFGSSAPEAQGRLQAVTELGLVRLGPLLRSRPVALQPLIQQALDKGDECHGRTLAANRVLVDALPGLVPADLAWLNANAGFVLPILMAAACWRLRAGSAGIAAGIAAVGGNGVEFGIRIAGEDRWRTLAALPPHGARFAGQQDTQALGAIGDSAVIDFCGLGGQALCFADALRDEWKSVLPADLLAHRNAVINVQTGLVDAACIVRNATAPLVDLAILDREGTAGLIGRGVYAPATRLFTSHP